MEDQGNMTAMNLINLKKQELNGNGVKHLALPGDYDMVESKTQIEDSQSFHKMVNASKKRNIDQFEAGLIDNLADNLIELVGDS